MLKYAISNFAKRMEGVKPFRRRSQRTGGRCEPGSGGLAAGAGAGRPKENAFSGRASRVCLRYTGRGLLEPSKSASSGREAGWYRGKRLSSREQVSAPGTFFVSGRAWKNSEKGEQML